MPARRAGALECSSTQCEAVACRVRIEAEILALTGRQDGA